MMIDMMTWYLHKFQRVQNCLTVLHTVYFRALAFRLLPWIASSAISNLRITVIFFVRILFIGRSVLLFFYSFNLMPFLTKVLNPITLITFPFLRFTWLTCPLKFRYFSVGHSLYVKEKWQTTVNYGTVVQVVVTSSCGIAIYCSNKMSTNHTTH